MAKEKSAVIASSKSIDPTLNALFSQSAGAIKTPSKSRYVELLPKKAREEPEEVEEEDDEELSELEDVEGSEEESGAEEEEGDSDAEEESETEDADDASSVDDEAEAASVLERAAALDTAQEDGRKRKRKQRDDDENLEAKYFERLENEEEPSGKRRKAAAEAKVEAGNPTKEEEDAVMKEDGESSEDELPVHESLKVDPVVSEIDKANRTVFLSNVSAEAVSSRKAKKILLNHLASVLDKKADPPQKVESIRFRSTAFQSSAIPKRAAYIKKTVMEATTKSTNAYAVYSTMAATRLATSQLNGTVVLDRHLRVDSVAHPAPVDHRRCVFVGNLGFVDDESVYNTTLNEEGKEVTEKRKRTKTPMDVEEGLWRVFGKEAGKVESVRVVRDAATRVGKGFAYVQFYSGNTVESAILLNGKNSPMLPANCAAQDRSTTSSSDRKAGFSSKRDDKRGKKSAADTGNKLLGRFAAEKFVGGGEGWGKKKHRDRRNRGMGKDSEASAGGAGGGARSAGGAGGARGSFGARGAGAGGQEGGFRKPEQFIFEGKRASAKDGKPKDLKFKVRAKGKGKANKKGGK
ncbi:Nucleolar protein 12 [Collariella sp. IMI 366227]|nr:Nucleolar protein 12 [Collariella sp. IMI 366227]